MHITFVHRPVRFGLAPEMARLLPSNVHPFIFNSADPIQGHRELEPTPADLGQKADHAHDWSMGTYRDEKNSAHIHTVAQ